jgi:hypothetical protein
MKNRRRLTIEHKYKLKNSTFTENDTDELIDKVHRENQEYQKNRITDEERINMLITIGEILSDERDEDNKEFDEKYKELGVNKFLGLFENLKDELEYESMRKYEIQNRLQREGKHDKLFRKFMNSYLTTIVLDNKMEMKK